MKAKEEALNEKQRILDSAKIDLADLAVDMARRVLGFDEQTRNNVLAGKAEKVGTREGLLKVAYEISDGEAAAITGKLEGILGANLRLQREVDPSLIGGFLAFIDGKVYDFSFAAQLASMKQQLS